MIAESDTFKVDAKALTNSLSTYAELVARTVATASDRHTTSLGLSPTRPTPQGKKNPRLISSHLSPSSQPQRNKKTLANRTGAEVCATPEKNENKKSEKDTDMVQTVYDRPKRRARVTAKGRSDKKVVSTKRRCTSSTPHDPATRAHGRHGSNQPRPEHPRASLGHGIFTNMPYAKWK
jgi:hypothetical protein